MKIAFVVATKDRPSDLRKMLQSLADQSRKPDEVIIVDSSSEPVHAVVKDFEGLNTKYLHHPKPSASAQRNAGIGAVGSDMDLIGFLDDDAVLEEGALEAMHKFWQDAPDDVGGSSFNLKNFEQPENQWLKNSRLARWAGLYSREKGVVMPSGWQSLMGTVDKTTYVQWLPSGASLWRRDLFKEFRFDEYFDGYSYLEDLDFSFSVSRKNRLVVVADAGFYHYPSPSGRVGAYQFGRMEVSNRIYIVRKHSLSLLRCYLGLFIRLLMTLGLAAKSGNTGYLMRAFGNCAGIGESLLPRKTR